MTFNVRVDAIRERTTNGPTYMKGRQYYRQGRVRHLSYDQEKGVILAQVEGTRTYNVRVILNGKGELHDATCTCSAFTAYWGLCRHIAATLLYCIDAFSKQKTHIQAGGVEKPTAPGSKVLIATEDNPNQISRQQQAARLQAQRRSRSKTRDFLARMENIARIASHTNKTLLKFQVTLHCSPSSTALPWLSFAVGESELYPILNVEQFAEAISRDLPLELDKTFALDPQRHAFQEQDRPLANLIRDAFENDYKAVFGTSHASSRDRNFTLNASRFAEFLTMSAGLSDAKWQFARESDRQPILIRKANLPISLRLSCLPDETKSHPENFKLEFVCEQNLQQMTASRNVYMVGGTFYLPSHNSIRLTEPILTIFSTPGLRHLTLTREETLFLLGEIKTSIQSVCPIDLDEEIAGRLVDEPLRTVIDMDYSAAGLAASLNFCYGTEAINPLSLPDSDKDANNRLVVRNHAGEEGIVQLLARAGFSRQGQLFRLADPDLIYQYLSDHASELQKIAEIRPSDSARQLRVLPSPDIRFRIGLDITQDSLLLRQNFNGLEKDERAGYVQALRDKRGYFRTPGGNFRRVALDNRNNLLTLIDLFHLWGVEPGQDDSRMPRYRALALENLLTSDDAADLMQLDDPVREMIHHLREPGALAFKIPGLLRGKLRPYQKTGFHWLCTLDYYGLGGILADDMGLGKTLQTIAYVGHIWRQSKKTSLIIAPTSLVYNWLSEFEKFAPSLPVMILDGNRQQRASLLSEISEKACIITSYSLLRRDIEDIGSLSFASCFLDEAQNIKNPETLNARSVKQIKADRCFALTGTPIENSLTELWSIFDFILPGYLHSQKIFQTTYEQPIVRDNDMEILDKLHSQIIPFILRRMKQDVLKELPDKIETITVCDMTDDQRQVYESFLLRSQAELDREVTKNGYARSQIFILALLTRLRQICCHPGLFLDQYAGGSGKLQLLDELLEDCFSSGHRVLVFSQFTSMLDIIRREQRKLGREPFYIDGQVPAEERLSQVQRFNNGEGQIFLISLRAGGTGLNLTGADTVIHYDPWWNPAVEEQATDRAYRIGQESVVQVFKLVTRHSIEEKIQLLQEKKQHLVDAIIKPGQNLLSKMTLEEVRSLFEP